MGTSIRALPREVTAGAVGSLVTIALVLTVGLIGLSPLGPRGAQLGILAAFVSAAMGGWVYALLDRSRLPVAAPSSPTALVYAGLLQQLLTDPALPADGALAASWVLTTAALAVVAAGLLLFAIGLLRLGRFAQYVPQPVLAGFMNGIAVTIVIGQLPMLLGLAAGTPLQAVRADPSSIQPGALGIGIATAVLTWFVAWRRPRAPAQLAGLVGGLLLYALLHAWQPGVRLGGAIGPLPQMLPLTDLPLRLAQPALDAFVLRHGGELLAAAAVIASLAALESMMCALALDRLIGTRTDIDASLRALGVANLVVGAFGALPLTRTRTRAVAVWHAGGNGRAAAAAAATTDALLLLAGAPLVAMLPTAVLAGLMLTVAAGLSDRWTRQLVAQFRSGERGAEVAQSLAVVAIVGFVTVISGFAPGAAVGLLLSLLVFVRSMNRSLVRSRFDGSRAPSRRVYPPAQEAFLRDARERIVVLELEGPLFFASGERLFAEARASVDTARCLVLDCRGVGTIDASGAVTLQLLSTWLAEHGTVLLLADVTADNRRGRQLRAFGCFRESPRSDWFVDVDRAMEAAERLLLHEAGLALDDTVLPLAASPLCRDLSAAQCSALDALMPLRRLQAGETLFRQGEAGDCLYVVERGSLTIVARLQSADGSTSEQRFLSVSPGGMLGEAAMLDGAGRSAGAVADVPTDVRVLTQAALDRLQAADAELAARLYRSIAVQLSQRLRGASAQASAPRPAPGDAAAV